MFVKGEGAWLLGVRKRVFYVKGGVERWSVIKKG